MTAPIQPEFVETSLDQIDAFEGKIVCFLTPAGGLDPLSRRVNKLAKGALARFSESPAFENMKVGATQTGLPVGHHHIHNPQRLIQP